MVGWFKEERGWGEKCEGGGRGRGEKWDWVDKRKSDEVNDGDVVSSFG